MNNFILQFRNQLALRITPKKIIQLRQIIWSWWPIDQTVSVYYSSRNASINQLSIANWNITPSCWKLMSFGSIIIVFGKFNYHLTVSITVFHLLIFIKLFQYLRASLYCVRRLLHKWHTSQFLNLKISRRIQWLIYILFFLEKSV